MAFFGTNLHAMLASISCSAENSGLIEAKAEIDRLINFFNDSGFKQQSCIVESGLRWEALTAQQSNQIKARPSVDTNEQLEKYVRITYLGRVIYVRPLFINGSVDDEHSECLVEIKGSTQRIPVPLGFILQQDKELFKRLIEENSGVAKENQGNP